MLPFNILAGPPTPFGADHQRGECGCGGDGVRGRGAAVREYVVGQPASAPGLSLRPVGSRQAL